MLASTDFPSEEDILVLPSTYTHDVDNSLPQYKPTDDQGFEARIANTPGLVLPIVTGYTADERWDRRGQERPEWRLQEDIIRSFLDAVADNHEDIVTQFISRGLVSPDVSHRYMETPLLVAVRTARINMVRLLVSLGATVDFYGHSTAILDLSLYQGRYTYRPEITYIMRTPLQYAAERGSLAMVKLLMEEFGADDALVAPDGALALRLAARNGHREIVTYLPVRRGGAWRRWEVKHESEIRKAKSACREIWWFVHLFVVELPKFMLYTAPKEAWKKRYEIARWAEKAFLRLGPRMARAGKAIVTGLKNLPEITRRLALKIRAYLARIPKVCKVIADWVERGCERIANTVVEAAKKLVSVLHTAAMAAVTFFGEATLQDVWNGIQIALAAVFRDLPVAVWRFIESAGEMLYEATIRMFGLAGEALYLIAYHTVHVALYIPRRLWGVVKAIAASMGTAYREVLVHLDPKRVS